MWGMRDKDGALSLSARIGRRRDGLIEAGARRRPRLTEQVERPI
jgi:hypothetical protein